MWKVICAFIVCLFILAICIRQCNEAENEPIVEAEVYSSNDSVSETVDGNSIQDEPAEIYQDPPKLQNGLEIPRLTDAMPNQILVREGYIVSYNHTTKCPNWVAWHLTKEHTDGEWSRKGMRYQEDLEAERPRQEYYDWDDNPEGYDHGHMCPAADNKWSSKAMQQTFLLTNMCPQDRTLNGGDWCELEDDCRTWANLFGDIYIACGPIYYNGKNKTIGGNKEIWVPDAFYKVVLCLAGNPKAIGFVYPNNSKHHLASECACDVNEIEEQTGIDFFFNLPDEIEERIESEYDYKDW